MYLLYTLSFFLTTMKFSNKTNNLPTRYTCHVCLLKDEKNYPINDFNKIHGTFSLEIWALRHLFIHQIGIACF